MMTLKIILGNISAVWCVKSDLVYSEGVCELSNVKSGIFNMLWGVWGVSWGQTYRMLNVMCRESESEVKKTQRGIKNKADKTTDGAKK